MQCVQRCRQTLEAHRDWRRIDQVMGIVAVVAYTIVPIGDAVALYWLGSSLNSETIESPEMPK